MNTNIYVLCRNYRAEGWVAVGVWDHKPVKEEILKMEIFNKNPDRKIEQVLAEKILEKGSCRLNYKDDNKYHTGRNWIEYMLINPEEDGNLYLNDKLLTGYCDFSEESNIYEAELEMFEECRECIYKDFYFCSDCVNRQRKNSYMSLKKAGYSSKK